jgi:hypothetical protein
MRELMFGLAVLMVRVMGSGGGERTVGLREIAVRTQSEDTSKELDTLEMVDFCQATKLLLKDESDVQPGDNEHAPVIQNATTTSPNAAGTVTSAGVPAPLPWASASTDMSPVNSTM